MVSSYNDKLDVADANARSTRDEAAKANAKVEELEDRVSDLEDRQN